MIITRIKGGLGNQLFQYASAYALSKRLGQGLLLDVSFFSTQQLRGYKLDKLNICSSGLYDAQKKVIHIYKNRYLNKVLRVTDCRVLPCGKDSVYLLETRSDIVSEFFLLQNKNVYLDGYFQSEKYFEQYKNELIEQFRPGYIHEKEYYEVETKIDACEAIAVHVRRGDFLSAQNDPNPNHYLLGEKYYYNALNYVENRINTPTFFWFSDDIEWVKQNFGDRQNFEYVSLRTKNADIDELVLMSKCRHIITANSTFSWWASWMNCQARSMHICPRKRYGNLHMVPEDWIKIDVE